MNRNSSSSKAGTSTDATSASKDDIVADGGAVAVAEGSPHTPQVSSKHWRKIRSAVTALAAFRSRRIKAADFERIRMCGEGGSGLVYLVKLKNTSMYFALKVQRKQDLEAKEKRIRRALIEKEVLVACAHPFVCNLYTAFQDSRHLYLVMDFCAGGDLNSLLRTVVKRTLTESEARFYISEIVAALEWVHLHGYVYRDLKPENVLIHASGHIRLGDFGTAERGSIRCCSGPGEKVCVQDVERAISESNAEQPAGGATPPVPAIKAAAAASVLPSGDADARDTEGYEDDADMDDTGHEEEGGDPDKALICSSVVVRVDPMLEEVADSCLCVPLEGAATAAATAATAAVPVAPASGGVSGGVSDAGSNAAVVLPRGEGGGAGTEQADAPARSPVECGCWGRKRRDRRPEGRTLDRTASAEHSEAFANGRGSVKLNVLLDSRTFIGTADFMAPEMVTGKEQQSAAMDWWALGVMLYEMTLGTLPFHNRLVQTSNDVFRSIVNAELTFPRGHKLSRSSVNFIRELLRKDPSKRLGERKGVGEIKRHPFFGSVHWALIAQATPPFVVSGPETPGWAASMASRPAGSRDDKMATWTWMATQEELRPTMPIGTSAASGAAGDCLGLDDLSECHGKTDVSKLEHELGIPPGPPEAAAGLATPTAVNDKEGGDDGGSGASVVGVDTRVDVNGSPSIAASALTPVSVPAGGGGGGAGGAPGGGVESVQAGGVGVYKPRKASFDGYDFNTLQKMGSIGVGRLNQGVPHLAAKRSSDFVKGRLP